VRNLRRPPSINASHRFMEFLPNFWTAAAVWAGVPGFSSAAPSAVFLIVTSL
jgi:hypothetical protein